MKVLVFFIVLLLSHSPTQGQTYSIQKPLVSRGHKPYFVKDKFYDFNELEFLFQDDKELARVYRAGIRNDVVAKTFGYTTLGLWGVAALSIVTDNSHTEGILNRGDAFGLLLILVSPITGTAGLIAKCNSVFKKNKAVDTYNRFYKDSFGRDIEQPQLGLAKSGMGLSISF